MDPVLELGATALSRRIAAGDLKPSDLMRATLDRIDAVNPGVTAIVSLRDREALMGEARVADAMAPVGWLHGIPMAIKDLVAVKGVRSTWGSPLLADNVPQADDPMVARLRAAGAIVIGKTNTPEFGLGSHSYNPVFGVTRNPYDRSRTAGGSSGGAAAALALRMLALADGSDMMGSLRNPAAWCNCYGFRPTAGLIPSDPGDSAFQDMLSTRGPMARDVDDLAALLETLSGGRFAAASVPAAPAAAPRIGWLGDWGGALPMAAGIPDLSEAALAAMTGLGWRVEAVAPPFSRDALWQSWTDLRALSVMLERGAYRQDPAQWAQLKPALHWEVARGLALSGAAVDRASTIRLDWLAALERLFARFDALVLPSAQVWPFPANWTWPERIGQTEMDSYHRWMEVVVPASLAGLPVLSLPAGFGTAGLPGGVQLIGPRGADAAILALGRAWHAATDWPGRCPPAAG